VSISDSIDSAGTANLAFLEELFGRYQADPASVSADWRAYFENLQRGWPAAGNGHVVAASPPVAASAPRSAALPSSPKLVAPDGIATAHAVAIANGAVELAAAPAGEAMPLPLPPLAVGSPREERVAFLQDRVDQLVRAYRVRGHLMAEIDPLGRPRPGLPELDPAFYHLTEEDMDRSFSTDTIEGPQSMSLRQIIRRLRNTYCRSIGVQFMHMDDLRVRQWLQVRMEGCENRVQLDRRQQLRIYRQMTTAAVFEEFIQKRFLGAKSFSLEGSETLIPLVEMAIERAAAQDIRDCVLAMAHRGRLNVLANVMGKSPQRIFREFADMDPELHVGRGDVKYHLGHSTDYKAANGRSVHLTLCFNPSHLEFVNPVAIGRMRSRQDRAGDRSRQHGMVILIHGDAAFAGEGIIQETLNLSELDAYRVGGTLHVIVNNQIGFTTGPREARSCMYATDVAKMLQIPIFHVNGEDPEAVAQVVNLAMDFRREFQRDVVIDMYCFRRRGHNEADEPAFTQPALYRVIEQRPSVHESYLEKLLKLGEVSADEARQIAEQQHAKLAADLTVAKSEEYVHRDDIGGLWAFYIGGRERDAAEVDTGVRRDVLEHLMQRLVALPEGFQPHAKIRKFLENRVQMAAGSMPLDWSAAESLAYASIVTQGLRLRISGQDSQRGTFSHRHAVIHDAVTDETYCSLEHLAPDQAPVEIHNSPLSEAGVLGFEYGYSLDCPDGLVIWEAQFGDFVNAAPPVRAGDAAPARLRGAGARARERTARTVPLVVREGQHPGCSADDARTDLPPAASPGTPRVAEAARGHDAQEPASSSRLRLPTRRPDEGDVPTRPRRCLRHAAPRHPPRAPLQREGSLRIGEAPAGTGPPRRGDHPRRTALSAAPAGPRAGARLVRSRHARRVGAGGAREHGGVAIHADPFRREAVRSIPVLRRMPPERRQPGHRFQEEPRSRAERTAHRRVHELTRFTPERPPDGGGSPCPSS